MPTAFVPEPSNSPKNLFGDTDFAAQRTFFTDRPELGATPLHNLAALAHHLRIGALLAKDETARFGLNAFKAAGAAFAIATLSQRGELAPGETLACASEGNHGRAVARAARDAGCQACVYMSASVAPARVEAIRGEHAQVVLVPGSYDDAVRAMAREAADRGWKVISDTSWPGYTEIPRLIMLGYTRLMDEAEARWSPGPPPDTVFVPGGVGGLLAAVACWCDWRYGAGRPHVVAVEPVSAACLQASVRRGRPVTVPGPFQTVMGGLRCGEMSPVAFPAISTLVDAFIAIEDEVAFEAMRLLARPFPGDPPVRSGPSGAAALAGLLATLHDQALSGVRSKLGLTRNSSVLVLVTEGVTDPPLFEKVLARG